MPMRLAMNMQMGKVAKIATKPSTPPKVRMHSTNSMIRTARLACFSLPSTVMTKRSIMVAAMHWAAPLSVRTLPKIPPRNTVGNTAVIMPHRPVMVSIPLASSKACAFASAPASAGSSTPPWRSTWPT